MRDALQWPEGAVLTVATSAQGVLLTPTRQHFSPTRLQDVRGCLRGHGAALSLDEIDDRVAQAFAQQWKDAAL